MDLLCAFSGFGGGVWYKTERWGWKDWQLLRALVTAAEDSGLTASMYVESYKHQ